MLGRQGVQQREPVLAADPEYAALGEVDEAAARLELALFHVRVAVVRGHALVGGFGRDGSGEVEQGGSHG